MSHDDAAMYERAIREGREKDETDPPIIRDLKEMAVDLQNLKGTVHTLEERMNILLLDQHNLKNLLGSISEEVESRRPYKCPVCKGTTFCKDGMCCIPCDGTGILWGQRQRKQSAQNVMAKVAIGGKTWLLWNLSLMA